MQEALDQLQTMRAERAAAGLPMADEPPDDGREGPRPTRPDFLDEDDADDAPPPPKKRKAPEKEPDDEPEAAEDPDEETEDTDEEPDEAEADAEPDEDSDEDSAVETLADVAKVLGKKPEDVLKTLKHTIKVDGEDRTLTLAELAQEAAKGADYTRKTQRLAEQARSYQTAHEAKVREIEGDHTKLVAVLTEQMQVANRALESPYAQQLRQTDPGRWAALAQQVQMEKSRLHEVQQQFSAMWSNQQAKLAQDHAARQAEQLAQKHPDWGEDHIRKVANTLYDLGFSDEEITGIAKGNALTDARLLSGAFELAELRAENQKLKRTLEARASKAQVKVKRKSDPGPVQKPGASRSLANKRELDEAAAMKRLAKTSNFEDAMAVMRLRRQQGG